MKRKVRPNIDEHTFGDFPSAVNLAKTLKRPEYQDYARTSCRMLSKQIAALKAIMFIPSKEVREATLLIFNKNFRTQINQRDIPDVVKTHICCVATGYYRHYLAISKEPEIVEVE